MVSRAAVLAKASEWVGMREQPDGSNNIEFSRDWGITGQSWCFAFVQSCFYYADPSPTGALPHQSMYCPYGIQWARDAGQAIEVGGSPAPGDIVFFSWDMNAWGRWTPGTGDHVGIVEDWDGGDTITTIEGNVGPRDGVSNPQGVWRRQRSISGTVVCFWRPTVLDDGTFGVAALPDKKEEDMTPEQVKMAEETRNLVGGAFDQAVAANARLDDIRNYVGGAYDQAVAANARLDALGPKVEALEAAVKATAGPKPPTLPPVKVVDVEASLKQATPAQLLAAVTEYFAKPDQPAADA